MGGRGRLAGHRRREGGKERICYIYNNSATFFLFKSKADTNCLLRKIDAGMQANARMHGWKRLDGIPPEEARKLPGPKVYDPRLRICYYKLA